MLSADCVLSCTLCIGERNKNNNTGSCCVLLALLWIRLEYELRFGIENMVFSKKYATGKCLWLILARFCSSTGCRKLFFNSPNLADCLERRYKTEHVQFPSFRSITLPTRCRKPDDELPFGDRRYPPPSAAESPPNLCG